MRVFVTFFLFIFLLFYSLVLKAQNNTEIWPSIFLLGSVKNHPQVKYTLDFESRFAIPRDQYHQILLGGGMGYQNTPCTSYWLGYTFASTRGSEITGIDRKNRLWQQLVYDAAHSDRYNLVLRTRLDESTQNTSQGVGVRIREKVHFKFPLANCKRITPEVFDEIFLNLTHPSWLDDSNLIDQNRFFAGVLIAASSRVSFDVGYLNQYQVRNNGNENNNALNVAMNITI